MFVKTLERNWKIDSNTHVVCLCLWTLLGYKSENYNALSSSLLYNLITFFIGLSQKSKNLKRKIDIPNSNTFTFLSFLD